MNLKNWIYDNVKTIFYALIIAIIIRSFFIQPFYIRSSSMEPGLLVGDRLFVTKYSLVIVDTHFHSVLEFLMEDFYIKILKEVM